jgi:hypothetical protein
MKLATRVLSIPLGPLGLLGLLGVLGGTGAGCNCSAIVGVECRADRVLCGGACIDPATDPDHCGACDRPCSPGNPCIGSACAADCPAGQTLCPDDRCHDLTTDPTRCGSCFVGCFATEECVQSTCLPLCAPSLVRCGLGCSDFATDPDNCGGCGQLCASGLCAAGACAGGTTGHLVVIGHNYRSTRAAQNRIVANAVLLSAVDPIGVLAYSEFADLGPGGTADNTDAALAQIAALIGRRIVVDRFAAASELAGRLDGHPVLLVYEQSGATDGQLRATGTAWAATLRTFLGSGGIVVVTDGGQGNIGTYQLVESAGLFAGVGLSGVTGATLRVVNPADGVAAGMPLSYRAELDSVRFVSTEPSVVVTDGTGPVVVHKVF